MDKRIVIGLIYGYDQGWIAGTYYIENLIESLLMLEDGERPVIKVYVENTHSLQRLQERAFSQDIAIIDVRIRQTIAERVINKITQFLWGRHLIVRGFDQKVDVIFPNPVSFFYHRMPNPMYWIPDFQEKHFPEFFKDEELRSRDLSHRKISRSGSAVVFSSKNALRDYLNYYPDNQTRNYVVPFAVTIPERSSINKNGLGSRYSGNKPYFICSNQFWAHKEHMTVLHAIKKMKDRGIPCRVLFTGKPEDHRNPDYFGELTDLIEDLSIADQVRFLGFIPRDEQINLLQNSVAIIQPSKFEGWSTIVEDAKALDQSIILSDIQVHQEQLPGYDGFFRTGDADDLSDKMIIAWEGSLARPNVDYRSNMRMFGRKFVETVTHECT